jgi:hypothetical protein
MRDIPFYQVAPRLSGLPVRVYRNLNKTSPTGQPVYSIKDTKTGLVLAHAVEVYVEHPLFVVKESGRQRVLREKRKNVHAWVEGWITTPERFDQRCRGRNSFLRDVTYNPYKFDSFVTTKMGRPVHAAGMALLDSDGVHGWNTRRFTDPTATLESRVFHGR